MRVLLVSDDASRRVALREAAKVLRAGRLVAFPTETVYGLGAHALDAEAVQRIYDAKGRPSLNPIIVHVATTQSARDLAAEWTPAAEVLADAFWPGPVTLVVRKRSVIPDIVTAGLDTVGLRVPAHPLALAVLEEVGVPVAAPSANLSTQVSPTTAQHVMRGLGDRVDLILDGGPTPVGIESTVVDVTGAVPRILRPGTIGRDAIARVAGAAETLAHGGGDRPRSPGLVGKHYAPRAEVVLWDAVERENAAVKARSAAAQGRRVGLMAFTPLGWELTLQRAMPRDPDAYAAMLYASLHAFDEARCDVVFVERPPDTPAWAAVADRLRRAAS
jgi:L-threonylcarbamoyladenylate synthase